MIKAMFHTLMIAVVLGLTPGLLRADFAADYKAALDLSRQGQHAEALAAFQKLAESAPTEGQKIESLEQASMTATRMGQHDQAIALAKQIPSATASLNAQARVLMAQRAWAKVVEAYEGQDIEQWPAQDLPVAAMQLGAGYWGQRKGEEAAKYYALAAEKHTEPRTRADMYTKLGDTYRTLLNNPDKALEAYAKVYEVTDQIQKHVFAAVGMATTYLQQNKLDEAWKELEKFDLVKISSTWARVELLRARAAVLTAQGKTAEALSTYREALDHRDIHPSQKKDLEAKVAELEGK